MHALRIAVDASRTTVAQRTGTENYALQLIRALIALDTPHHLDLYFRDPPPTGLFSARPHVTQHVIPWPRAWTHLRFSAALWLHRPDITFVPAHTLPRWFPGKAVVTVHDLGYVYFPDAHPGLSRRYLDWSTRYSVRRAARIMVDSLATARDLAAHYRVPENKMSLVYPGVDDSMTRVSDPAALAAVRARYDLPERYLLFVGTLQPRKNIARIVQAYALARRSMPGVALVLAGQQGWLYDPQWTAGIEGVILPGYIHDADRTALYSGALALAFPTLHEGFGFPVLEAMRCGTPVITSNTSSLPEVAGDAAVLVNPRDIGAISRAMEQVVSDQNLRAALVDKGYQQAERFTWRQAAEQALRTLETVVGQS